MAKVNIRTSSSTETYEGGKGKILSPEKELVRAVMTCMLYEPTFYEGKDERAIRIKALCARVSPQLIADLAIKARNDMQLRTVSLFLARELARSLKGRLVSDTIYSVIQRADELAEFMAMYFMDKKQPVSKQVKLGLARAFGKFNEYQLAKYNGGAKAVKLRDVLFLCHAKPKDDEQQALWQRLIENKLKVPDTWETQLSAGKDKKATFERLILEGKLGYMALLRNLRNMEEAKCDTTLIRGALMDAKAIEKSRVLPFRFMAAHNNIVCNELKMAVRNAFMASLDNLPYLDGKTAIFVDVSGSMDAKISDKSDMHCIDAATCLAAILKENSLATIYSFSSEVVKVESIRHGLDFAEDIDKSQDHAGTYLGQALNSVDLNKFDRVIVISDEQSHDDIPDCKAKDGYIINLCGYKPSVTYAKNWEVIGGWSDRVISYINEIEKLEKWDV